MIKEIVGDKVTVENREKPAGTYLLSDFNKEELLEQKAMLTSMLFAVKAEESGRIYDMIMLIYGELDRRTLAGLKDDKYFKLAAGFSRSFAKLEVERRIKHNKM